jgi:hypothetical protein
MRPFRTDPPTDFRSYPLKILLDADIGKVHTQRIRDRQDDSDRLPLSMHLTDSCERRSSVSKCTPEWDEKLSFLATFRHKLDRRALCCIR